MFDEKYITVHDNRFYADILMDNTDQLISSGINQNNIEYSPFCTYEEKDYLHSYRRDRENSGRMFTVIGLK